MKTCAPHVNPATRYVGGSSLVSRKIARGDQLAVNDSGVMLAQVGIPRRQRCLEAVRGAEWAVGHSQAVERRVKFDGWARSFAPLPHLLQSQRL